MRADNFSVSLPQGQYYFYAWSASTNRLDSFGKTQTQVIGPSFSPLIILPSAFLAAVGAFLIVLAASILTKRIWR